MNELHEDTFFLFAMKNYTNNQCNSMDEFNADMMRLNNIQRHLVRLHEDRPCNIRLLLNHVITIFNVFELNAAKKMLYFKVNKKYHTLLSTILLYLNYIPKTQISENVIINKELLNRLENL